MQNIHLLDISAKNVVIINKTVCQRHHRGFPKITKKYLKTTNLWFFLFNFEISNFSLTAAAWPRFLFPLLRLSPCGI